MVTFFTFKYKRSSKSGLKFFYSCSPENASCSSSAYLLIKKDTISVFFCDVEHTHVPKASRGISKVVKDAIEKFFDVGVTAPKANLRALEKEGYEKPSITQLNTFLTGLRQKKLGSPSINLSELETWCKGRREIPN